MIDGRNIFGQLVKNNMITYKNRKRAMIKKDDHFTGCLLD